MDITTDTLLDQYEKRLGFLADDGHADTEAIFVLFKRDELAERESSDLTSDQRKRLNELDQILVDKRELISEILPNYLSKDRNRWWWFLDERIPNA